MKRRLFVAGVAALPCAGARAAADPLAAVRARLVESPVLTGSFEQRKTVKGFRQPLVSRGEFVVARDRGVVWATREPFTSSLIVTRDRLLSRLADGSVAQQVDASREPGIRAVNELLFALMAANLAVLADRFAIEATLIGKTGWRLELKPRQASLAQWVRDVELSGERVVQRVRLTEASGDSSEILMTGVTPAAALSADDARRFE